MKDNINKEIREIFSSTMSLNIETLGNNVSPSNLEAWDSLRHMRLLLALEQNFSISFDDEEIFEMVNLEKITQIINLKVRNDK